MPPLTSYAKNGDVTIAYETFGERAADDSNVVLILHALTGDSHVVGSPGPGRS